MSEVVLFHHIQGLTEGVRSLAESTDGGELHLYPGDQHLFADSSLPDYDAAATALLLERVLPFLDLVPANA